MDDSPIKILLIEDSLFATRHTQKMLAEAESDQFHTTLACAERLSVGLERLAEDAIDIVLLDLTLPDSDELDTFTQVQAHAPQVPIVVMSGLEDETLAIEAVNKGAQDYLVKGQVDSSLLKRSILYAIERKQAETELNKHREHLEELVEQRTAELQRINAELIAEMAVRKQAEEDLREAYAQLEKQSMLLVQTEKMSAIGTLVAGVAHELNNPLTAMLHFAQYCLKHTTEDDRRYTVLQDIEHETKRCADIVNNLLTFSHAEDGKWHRYAMEDVATILARVLKLLSYRIEKLDVSLTSHINEATPKIRMKANAMQEVFLNLLANALDALEQGEKKELHIDCHPDGDVVRISVADSGSGISPEHQTNIFDPFFTTKPVGKGTGLGLALCQGIIQAHGGEISCESELGKGTVFHVSIPITIRKGVPRDEARISD